MTDDEQLLLEALDTRLRSGELRAQIQAIVQRVRRELSRKHEYAVMAWEPVPLMMYGDGLPAQIRSSWVFVLRAAADTGPERHPNSHQRMMSFEGSGDMRVAEISSGRGRSGCGGAKSDAISGIEPEHGQPQLPWTSNVLASDLEAPLDRRWVSIPQLVWHRPVVGRDADWAVVSFHTVPAEELIGERPSLACGSGTRQMRYLEERLSD
jgi:hypothetical protein